MPYIIRTPETQHEFEQACSKIEQVYTDVGHISGPFQERPSVMFIAKEGNTLLGAVGIFIGEFERKLPTEVFFGLDLGAANRRQTVEITRLTVFISKELRRRALVDGLILAVWHWCQLHHVETAIASIKPPLKRALEERLGIALTHWSHEIQKDQIPPEYGGYFNNQDPPQAIRVSIRSATPRLQARLVQLLTSDAIRFTRNGSFDYQTRVNELPRTRTRDSGRIEGGDQSVTARSGQ